MPAVRSPGPRGPDEFSPERGSVEVRSAPRCSSVRAAVAPRRRLPRAGRAVRARPPWRQTPYESYSTHEKAYGKGRPKKGRPFPIITRTSQGNGENTRDAPHYPQPPVRLCCHHAPAADSPANAKPLTTQNRSITTQTRDCRRRRRWAGWGRYLTITLPTMPM